MFSKVVLPDPLGPIKANILPDVISPDMLYRIFLTPFPVFIFFVRPFHLRIYSLAFQALLLGMSIILFVVIYYGLLLLYILI